MKKLCHIEKNCQYCGAKITKNPKWSIKQYEEQKYCGWLCFSKSQTYDLNKTKEEFLKKIIIKENGCHEWQGGKCQKGYGMFRYNGKTIRAHRFAWFVKTGDLIPDKIMACHKCDNPSCVNPEHIFLGSGKDNYEDMKNKGRDRKLKGQDCSRSLLNNEMVLKIYKDKNLTQLELSKIYKVSPSTISAIKNGQNWSSITGHKNVFRSQK